MKENNMWVALNRVKKHVVVGLFMPLLAIFMVSSGGCGGGSGGTGGYDLNGKVLSIQDAPLAGVSVVLETTENVKVGEMTSAVDGTFAFAGISERTTLLKAHVGDSPTTKIKVTFPDSSNSASIVLSESGSGYFNSELVKDPANPETTGISLIGNLDSSASIFGAELIPVEPSEYEILYQVAMFATSIPVKDSSGALHPVNLFFFHVAAADFVVQAYVDDVEVHAGNSASGKPRKISPDIQLHFNSAGSLAGGDVEAVISIPWANGAAAGSFILSFNDYTSFATASNIVSMHLE